MSESWQDLLTRVEKETGATIKAEVVKLVDFAKNDKTEFLKGCSERLEKHLAQLAARTITADQFRGYMEDEKRLLQMEMIKLNIAQKAAAQRVMDGIGKNLVDVLTTLAKRIGY